MTRRRAVVILALTAIAVAAGFAVLRPPAFVFSMFAHERPSAVDHNPVPPLPGGPACALR